MNILFLTMSAFTEIEIHNIYADLMKEYIRNGHRPYIVTPSEKKLGEKTELVNYPDYSILKVEIGNINGVSLIEKGISTVTLSGKFYHAVKHNLGHLKFDLILYSTPPITLATPVKRLKKLFGCRTYLMLKDIFPQNAVDLGMFSQHGVIYWYFREQEKQLYRISDYIGCMSPSNVEYVKKHNPQIPKECIEICPNAIKPQNVTHMRDVSIRTKYGIPEESVVFMYGGNLGKPQGIPFLMECIRCLKSHRDAFLVVCGNGSEYQMLYDLKHNEDIDNWILIQGLPKKEYDSLLAVCDVGLVFLDNRFTIPNFPSRILSYMEQSIPVLACTDMVTDIGKVITEGRFGWWCQSNDSNGFSKICGEILKNRENLSEIGGNGRRFLEENYHVEIAYKVIQTHLESRR